MSTVNVFGMNVDQTYFWGAILVAIIIVSISAGGWSSYKYGGIGGGHAPFIPAQPWIQYPEYPAPYRTDRLYLGGSTKCFSCEKDVIEKGLPTYLSRPNKCFDCEAQAVGTYGNWAGQFGQNNKCYSCESQYANNPFKLKGEINKKSICAQQKFTPLYANNLGCSPAPSQVSRFGTAYGNAYNDHIKNDGVGLVTGFGRADGRGNAEDIREGDQNPTGYTLS